MKKEFNNLEEIQQYYDKNINTYVFKENNKYIELVTFNFDLNIEANIVAKDINARNIKAFNIFADNINAKNIQSYNIKSEDIYAKNIRALAIHSWNLDADDIKANDIEAYYITAKDIYASDISAVNIEANDISSFAVWVAYKTIKCKSISGRVDNANHFVLDGKFVVKNGTQRSTRSN